MRERKDELLRAATHYLLEHGVANLSLRPLAEAIGTSARLLIFHFKSKEALLGEVLGEIQARSQASFMAFCTQQPTPDALLLFKRFWHWATLPENLPSARLTYELHILAIQQPARYGQYANTSTAHWLQLIQAMMPTPQPDLSMATLCAALFDGLMLETLASGDLARTTAALDRFIALLTQIAASTAASKGFSR